MIQSDVMPSSTIYGTIWSGIRQSWKWADDNTNPRHCFLAPFKSLHPEPQNLMSPCCVWYSFIYIIFLLYYIYYILLLENQTFPCIILSVNVITRQPQITRTEEESDTVLLLCCLVDWTALWHVAFTPQTRCLHVKCWWKQKWDGSEWG